MHSETNRPSPNIMRTSNDERTASPTALTYFLAGIVAGGLIGGIVGYLAHDLLNAEPIPAPGSDELWVPRPADAENAPWLDSASAPPNGTDAGQSPSSNSNSLPVDADPFAEPAPSPLPANWLGDNQDPSPANPTETEVDPGGARLNPNDDSMFDAPEP